MFVYRNIGCIRGTFCQRMMIGDGSTMPILCEGVMCQDHLCPFHRIVTITDIQQGRPTLPGVTRVTTLLVFKCGITLLSSHGLGLQRAGLGSTTPG